MNGPDHVILEVFIEVIFRPKEAFGGLTAYFVAGRAYGPLIMTQVNRAPNTDKIFITSMFYCVSSCARGTLVR